MAADLLQWHDAFHASIQIELQREPAHLEFYSEHELYKKALRIDTLIIKDSDDTPVQKNIGKHEISMQDMTITFVCNHYPRKMLKILKKERNIEIEQTEKGIYRLKNDPITMQILLTSKLLPEDNLWLSSLTRNLPINRNTEKLLREYQ